MGRYTWIVGLCLAVLSWAMPGHAKAEPGRDRAGTVTVQDGRPSLNRPKTANGRPLTAEQKRANQAENEAFLLMVSLAFIGLASCTLILFVLGCGSRVVVFADAADAFRSACIFIAPVVSCFVALGVAWVFSLDPDRTYASVWTALKANPAVAFVLAVGVLWWAWAIIGTVVSSIQHNGLVVGLMVAILKIGAVFSLLLIWYGIVMNYDRTDSIEETTSKIFLFGILAWFGSKFLNGERVSYRRQTREDHSQSLVEA